MDYVAYKSKAEKKLWSSITRLKDIKTRYFAFDVMGGMHKIKQSIHDIKQVKNIPFIKFKIKK